MKINRKLKEWLISDNFWKRLASIFVHFVIIKIILNILTTTFNLIWGFG